MSIFTILSFVTKNRGILSETLNAAVAAVTSQSQRSAANSTKRNAAFTMVREIVPSQVGDSWINLSIELALAILRWRGVIS